MRRGLLILLVLLLPVSGFTLTISGEADWRGELTINELVRVEPGAHLRIAPGTRVVFTAGGLEVAGRLTARGVAFSGDNWSGIVLKGTELSTLISAGKVSGAATGILIVGGAPRIEGVTLSGNRIGLEVRNKSTATVSGCAFVENRRVGLFIKDEATPAVVNNQFTLNGKFGAYIYRANPRRFAGNAFNQNPTGLMISHHGSNPLLEENCLTDNEVAIKVDRAARPTLRRNDIRGNKTGLRLYRRADPLVERNRISGNVVGVSLAFSSYPQIHHNDLGGNGQALFLEFQSSAWEREHGAAARSAEASSGAFGGQRQSQVAEQDKAPQQLDGTIDARNNWWGADAFPSADQPDGALNPEFIHDGRDQPTFSEGGRDYPLDKVDFSPWLQEAVWE